MSGWFVTTNDIRTWTETEKRRSEEVLPLLVKKLILASCNPKTIDFPSGDSVSVGGWDGVLEVEKGNQFIPDGISGWEIGTNDVVKDKADGDYAKRTEDPRPLNLEDTTFVFVTSRLWSKNKTWCAEKNSEDKWKDVQGINAESLSSWLEQCPAVHRWFASIIGKRTAGLWDLEEAWGAFSCATDVNLSIDFLLGDRLSQSEELEKRLKGTASIIRIKASSGKEAYGFALAFLSKNELYKTSTLVVKDQEAWDWLLNFKQLLILIPDGFSPDNVGYAVDRGHFVILPLDQRSTSKADISISKISRQACIDSLQPMGLTKEQAETVYQDTRGFFGPIVRHDFLKPRDIEQPDWVENTNPEVLFGLLFATEWDSDNDYDKEALASISGIKYDEFEAEIIKLSQSIDPPVRPVGNKWQLISKFDTWLHIAPKISKVILDRLDAVIPDVLGDDDPSFDLEPDERYMANIEGAIPKYSSLIKSGLANTLALLATYADEFSDQAGEILPSDRIATLVRKLFQNSVHARVWYSIGSNLPVIAEAAPEKVLDAVEKATQGDPAPIKELFSEGDGIFSGCPHSNLLWALEGISWNTDYLPRVSINLARLSEIDPGGTYSNRPFSSLVDIYLGWIRNTNATYDERIEILKNVLVKEYPALAWRLMISLLINKTRTTSGIHKPEYRDWVESLDRSVIRDEYYKYISDLVDILLSMLDDDLGKRICDLIDNFNSYNDEQKDTVIKKLNEIDLASINEDDRDNLLQKLRHIISHHREFSDADWSWPEEIINSLEEFYNSALPDDLVIANKYLFSNHWPDLIRPIKRGEIDHEERNKQLEEIKISILEQIHEKNGKQGISDLIEECLISGIVGNVLAKSKCGDEYEDDVFEWIGSESEAFINAGRSYVSIRSEHDWKWVESTINNCDWDVEKRVSFLLGLNLSENLFSLLNNQDSNVQKGFWSKLNYYFLPRELLGHTRLVVNSLFDNDRPLAAIDAAGQVLLGNGGAKYLDTSEVANILKRIATEPTDIEKVSVQNIKHDILQAIEFVQDQADLPEEEISQIEWMFMKMFRFEGVKPRFLEQKISKDPSFFVQLVSWVFRPEEEYSEPEDIDEEVAKQRAEISYELLDTASILPGLEGDTFDETKLNSWVDQAREGFINVKRLGIGDDQIGKYLSQCPEGDDGVWPHEAIRDVIEKHKSDEFDAGFSVGRANARGVTSRNPFDGGELERNLANLYQEEAEKIKLKWPRTADILRNMARSYEYHARHEDRSVELRE